MALKLADICYNISTLEIAGCDIADLNEIPDAWDGRVPLMFPRPDGFLTDLTFEAAAFGANATRPWDVNYTLHYTLCFAKPGTDRGLKAIYPEMLDLVVDILDALLANPVDTVRFEIDSIPLFGAVADPTGNAAFGCEFTVRVMEFVN